MKSKNGLNEQSSRSLAPRPHVLVLVGPTGSGKSGLAVEIAKRWSHPKSLEILSIDSIAAYKEFNIGTAKLTEEEKAGIPHHLIDLFEPTEAVNASLFMKTADEKIQEILARGNVPFLVGGSGFYLRALTRGMVEAPASDPVLTLKLENELSQVGAQALHQRLFEIDPETAQKFSPNDTYRLIRALCVFEQTGKRFSQFHKEHETQIATHGEKYKSLWLGLSITKAELKPHIQKRTEEMLKKGLLEETQSLLKKGYNLKNSPPLRSIGYKEALDYLAGELPTLEALSQKITQETLRLAKSQRTWFKRFSEINWYHPITEKLLLIETALHLQDELS